MKLERLGSGWIRGGVKAEDDNGEIGARAMSGGEMGVRGMGVSTLSLGTMGGGGGGGEGNGINEAFSLTEEEIEERELVEWASLKECQVRFMRENGMGWVD